MAKKQLTNAQRKRHQEAADWIFRNGQADLSSKEREAFQQWLSKEPENARAYEAAQMLLGDASSAIKSDPVLRNFEAEPAQPGKIVGVTVLGLGCLVGLFMHFDGPTRLQADAYAGVSEMPVIELQDGSTIHLNASSAVAFDYTDRKRSIRLLKGQALFTVAKDPNRPFTVEAGEARVTALGTAFDIRHRDDEIDVSVTHNSVLVEFEEKSNEPLRLHQGESISYTEEGFVSEISKADLNTVLAWQRDQLVLDNAPLSYIVEELQGRFYGKIVIADADLASRKLSGTISIKDIHATLAFLEKALGVKSTIVGPLIILRS